IFLVLTDGLENDSREYISDQIRQRIKTQEEEFSWRFVFMGADEKSILDANNMGISAKNYVQAENTSRGMNNAFKTMNSAVTSYVSNTEYDLQRDYDNSLVED